MIQAVQNSESRILEGLVRTPCPLCQSQHSQPETTVAGYELEKCSDCGLVFMNPRCTPDHLSEIYTVRDEEELIALYSRIATPTVLREYDEKLQQIERLVPRKGRLLDFACAAGYLFELAQKRGWDAHGCDIGEWTRQAAKKRNLKNMHVGDFDELGFPDNHFDVIYAAQVFEHLLSPHEVLARLKQVLKPGGLLFVNVPNYRTLPTMFGRDDFMLNEPPQHVNYFTPGTLRKLLADGGMKSIRMSSCGGIKWELLLGKPITSEVAAAYGLVDDKTLDHSSSLVSRCRTSLKDMARSAVVTPVFYRSLKVGMVLESYSWKPE